MCSATLHLPGKSGEFWGTMETAIGRMGTLVLWYENFVLSWVL
jgi:hypothetical protein